MKTSKKELSKTECELTVELDEKEISQANNTALAKLSIDAKIPGFRQGHAPKEVTRKYVDSSKLAESTVEEAINESLTNIVGSGKIQIVSRPDIEIKKFVPYSQLIFTAKFEIVPEVKLGDYKKLSIKENNKEVNDKDVKDYIDHILNSMAKPKKVERAARQNDQVDINFIGKKDGVAFKGGSANNYKLILGSKTFIPGFEESIVGHKVSETFDINVTFPKDYGDSTLSGKPVVFSVTLNDIFELEKPELSDEIAAKIGPFKTKDELIDDVKKELAISKQRHFEEAVENDLIEQLVEASTVEAPKALVENQINLIKQDLNQNLSYHGINFEKYLSDGKYKDESDWIEKFARPEAIKRVKSSIVLYEFAKSEKIEVNNTDIEDRIDLYKKQYANNKSIADQFSLPEVRKEIADRLLSEKALKHLFDLNVKK